MRSAEFQVIDPVSGARTMLPDVASWVISPVADGSGAVQVTYPAAGRNFAVLRSFVDGDRDALVAVRIDGQETPDFTCVMAEAQGDTADPAAVWTFSGRFQAVYLDQAVVYPDPDSPVVTTDGGLGAAARSFGAMNAGQVFGLLLGEAQARGAASLVTYASFSSSTDSNGAAWTTTVTTSCSPGTTILSLLNTLSQAGLMDWQMSGADLRLYNPGTLGRDLTLSVPPVILHGPRDLTQAQRTFSAQDSVTALLVAGGAGLYTTATDPTAQSRRGRRVEGYVSAGNVSDPGTLTAYAETSLTAAETGVLQVTHGLAMAGDGPLPLDDFDVADWIWSDTGNGLERLQVAQWSVAMDGNGILTGTVTLNNLVAARLVKLQRQINALSDGSTVVGTSSPPSFVPDEIAPDAPAGLTASSLAFVADTGVTEAQVTAGWTAPTLNVDSSPLIDLAGYNVQWAYATGQGLATQWNPVGGSITGTSVSWSPLLPGVHVNVQVQAVDTSGNASSWTSSFSLVTASDATAPPEPSTPVAVPYLGQLKITWDGLSSTAGPMPPDFAACQVHVSLVSGFTPSSATLTDLLTGPGNSIATDLIYGDTYYVKFVAEDFSGNLSTPSAQASAVPVQAANGDISSLSVGKLTAGVLSADVTLSARFATSLTGARTEMNSSGLFQYASDGITILAEISSGAIMMTGTFITEASDGSFVKLWTSPGSAVVQLQPPGGVAHLTGMQLFGGVNNVGSSTERSIMVLTSGKESGNDDAALQLFADDASATLGAAAVIEFGGTQVLQVTRANMNYTSTVNNGAGTHPTLVLHGAGVDLTMNDGSGHGEGFTAISGSISASRGSEHHVQAADGSTYVAIFASAFNVVSDPALKSGIVPAEPGAGLQVIRNAPVSRWSLTSDPGRVYLGPMATDFPPEMTVRPERAPGDQGRGPLNLPLVNMIGALFHAVYELDLEMDQLRSARPDRKALK